MSNCADPTSPGTIRPARPQDVPEVLAMVRELADFEHSLEQVQMSEDQLMALLFGGTAQAPGVAAPTPSGQPAAYCHVVEHHGEGRTLGGIAIWFLNLSTWTGTHNLYLEDLYVRPEVRGLGYGTSLLRALAQVCIERGYQRFEWWVLDWNQPAVELYRKIGAIAMDEWTVHRVTGEALIGLADGPPLPSPPSL